MSRNLVPPMALAGELAYILVYVYKSGMKLHCLQRIAQDNPAKFPRFILPDGGQIPPHVHLTEVGHVTKNFIDCGRATGSEETVVLQTHVGNDTDHRLRADRFAQILSSADRVVPRGDLEVEVEYDCCVVSQYPVLETRVSGERLEIILGRKTTHCRERERAKNEIAEACCVSASACC